LFKVSIVVVLLVSSACNLFAAEVTATQELQKELLNLRPLVLKDPIAAQNRLLEMDAKLIASDKSLNLWWLLRAAQTYNYSYQFDDFESAIRKAVSLTDDETSEHVRAALYLYQGIVYQRNGLYDLAKTELEKAVELSKATQENIQRAYAYLELAYTYALEERFEEALILNQKAYLAGSESENQLVIAQVNEVYAAIYDYMDKPADSIRYYLKATATFKQLGYPYYIGEAAFGLGTTYRRAGLYEKALIEYTKYRQVLKNINSNYTQFFYQYGTGMTYAMMGDCDNALPIIAEALKVDEFKDYIAELYKKQATCFAQQQRFDEADKAIEAAKLIFADMPELVGTTWVLETILVEARIAASKGEYATAYQKLDSYYHKYLKAYKANTSDRIEKIKLDLQQEREQLEMAVLENQSKVQQLTLNNQLKKIELQRLWLFGSIAFILFILSFLWWQLRVSYKLKSLAITDELTGLSNRRYIFAAIERILMNKSSRKFHHSLLLIDVDDLKPINDQYGHQEGDKVLKMVAKAGRKFSRDSDIFARIGGDEYMLLVTRTDAEKEIAIAKRIIETISETPVITDSGEAIEVSVSVGIASIEPHHKTPESIYAQVDEALYRAKSSGRNCYCR